MTIGVSRDSIVEDLTAHRVELESLGVRHLFLFGSRARGDAGPDSDVDIMVDLDEGPGGRKPLFSAFDLGGIQFALTDLLGRRVDFLVRADCMKPGKRLRDVARNNPVNVF